MTDINRRGFFGRMAAAVAGAMALNIDTAEDPERLLWRPDAKKIIDLGAGRLHTPTLVQTMQVSLPNTVELDVTQAGHHMTETWLAKAPSHLQTDPLRPIYLPDRYRIVTQEYGKVTSMNFDSHWKPTHGNVNGQRLSGEQLTEHARRLIGTRPNWQLKESYLKVTKE